MLNERKAAVDILLKINKDGAYSNLTLAAYFKDKDFGSSEKAFISAVVYGVLDRRLTLDWCLSKFMKTPIKKTAPFTLEVLRTALYQILYMDRVPDSAAVDEAVKLIKKSSQSRNSGFVNAVLRSILRCESLLPSGDSAEDLSVRYSCPLWIVESFLKDYGTEDTKALLEESLKPAPVTVKVNTLKTDEDSLIELLQKDGISVIKNGADNSFNLQKGIDLSRCKPFTDGLFYIEDAACQKAVAALELKKGERVLDICAAPGGKSFAASIEMQNEGEIVSCDLYESRVGLIESGAKRLGIDIIKPLINDATVYNPDLGLFDAVICDVPCSGLGVLRRKPEIKYKPNEDFSELEKIQYNIFKTALRYLKPGGRILYSTCTLRRSENEMLVIRAKKEYNNCSVRFEKTLMPHKDGTDGFYFAVMEF